MGTTSQEEALLLIEAIIKGFRRGALHFDQHHKLLCSVEEVIVALMEGPVTVEDTTAINEPIRLAPL